MQRTARARAGLALLTALAALALTAAPALAVEGHTFSTSFNGGTEHPLSEPEGLGIDQMTGEVYVADRKNNDVEVFNASGTWLATIGKAGTGKGEFKEPTELAVDNSEGLGEGDLAVIDAGNKRVEIFNAKHEPIIELSTAELNKVEPNKGGLQKLDGIAYDTDGDLWLFLTKNGVNEVYERTEGGTLDRAFEVKEEFKGGLAVTPAGTILFGSSSGVSQFGPAGEGLEGFGHEEAAGGETTGVTLDPVGEGAYVDRGVEVAHFPAPRSKELARSDDFGTSGSGKLAMGVGIAVRGSTHDVYVADSAEHRVDAFAPVTLASASQEPVTGVTPTSAYVSGQVDPDGVAVSTCEFEYEEGKKTQACSPTPGSGSSYEKVSASLSGLTEGKNYEVRLSVTDADGVSYAQQLPRFTTPYSFQAKTAGEGTGSLECEVEGKTKEPCADAYPKGTVLTAYAQPGSESTFEGWTVLEGPTKCNGTSEPCFMAIEQPRKIVANFAKNTGATKYPLTVKKTGAGRGTVESSPSGIDCKPAEGECSHEFEEGKSVELKQTPEAGSEFVKWTGCDSEAAGKCLVTMTAPKTVEAEFKLSSTTVLPKPVSEPPSNVELEVQSGHPIVTATLHGKLAPEGVPLSSCAFEYGTSTSYGQTAPCVPAAKEIPTGGETPVTARVTLAPGTTYHYRLSAANKNGGALGADESFATPARTVGEAAWWRLNSTSRPSSLQPGKTGVLVVVLEDVGDGPVDALGDPVTIDDALPHGLRATGAGAITVFSNDSGAVPCAPREAGAAVTCTFSGHAPEMPGEPREKTFMEDSGLPPFVDIELRIPVQVSETASLCEPHSPTCERNLVDVSGGGAPPASLSRPVLVSPSPPAFGVADDEFDPEEAGGAADTQAGSHPFQVGFDVVLNQDLEEGEYGAPGEGERPFVHPVALAKDLRFKLPPGFVGDPSAIPACPISKFLHGTLAGNAKTNECPADTAIGVATTGYLLPRSFGYRVVDLPFFNLEPQVGEPARFGFFVPEGESGIGVFIDTAVRAGEDYGVTSTTSNISQQVAFAFAKVTLWGVPGDPRHDPQRGYGCLDTAEGPIPGLSCTGLEGTHPPPFFDMPTSCTGPLHTSVEADSWQDQGHFQSFASEPVPAMQGCNHLQFTPEIKVTPDGTRASTPTGLDVDVHVPQEGQLNAEGLAQSNIRGIQVTLPAGVTLNPSAADGLAACTANTASPLGGALGVPGNQVGYEGIRALEGEPGVSAPTFTPYKPQSTDALAAGFSEPFQQGVNFCPDASKVATVTIKTPLLPNPVLGAVYLASPQNFNVFPPENPFSKHVAMYILAEDPVSGALVKLPGRVELGGEPGASVELAPGQIRSYFEDNPQLPFEDAEVHFFGGERAPLATPDHCGTYTTQALYTPWDGGEPVHSSSSFQITSGPNGGPCPGPSLPFTPELHSSVTNINAGSFSDLSTTLSRPTGDQDIGSVTLHYPPGVSGLLSGVELCGEPQADEGTCGPNSQIGETIVSVGVGGEPFTVTGGRAYLTGPYNGSGSCTPGQPGCAPFGLSIVNPAKAGPFVLQQGRPVIVRAKVEVDPTTAALTVTTDASGAHAIPTIVEGFPLQIQHVNVLVNRPGFTFNPTSCNPLRVTGTIASAEGSSSPLSDPFQVTNCAVLKFEPKTTVTTLAKTSKADGASLNFKIEYPKGAMGSNSWFKLAKFTIPKQLPARLTTIQQACLAKVFEANPESCPGPSKIGHAIVHTQVLPVPLEGTVYFVSYGSAKFPDAIIVLKGYGITVNLVGETFIGGGVTSATFANNPDVPFESIEVNVPEGPYSEFAANTDLCTSKLTLPTEFKAQNGLEIHQSTPIETLGCSTKLAIISKKLKKQTLTLSVYAPSAGRVTATGKGLTNGIKTYKAREVLTFTLHQTRGGKLHTKIKLTFTPAKGKRQTETLKASFKK